MLTSTTSRMVYAALDERLNKSIDALLDELPRTEWYQLLDELQDERDFIERIELDMELEALMFDIMDEILDEIEDDLRDYLLDELAEDALDDLLDGVSPEVQGDELDEELDWRLECVKGTLMRRLMIEVLDEVQYVLLERLESRVLHKLVTTYLERNLVC